MMGTHNGVFCEEDEAPIKPTYEQLEQLYFAQCEATDEWADKCEQLKQENASLIHDLNQYILIANTTSTDLAQAQSEKAELVEAVSAIKQCFEDGDKMKLMALVPLGRLLALEKFL